MTERFSTLKTLSKLSSQTLPKPGQNGHFFKWTRSQLFENVRTLTLSPPMGLKVYFSIVKEEIIYWGVIENVPEGTYLANYFCSYTCKQTMTS